MEKAWKLPYIGKDYHLLGDAIDQARRNSGSNHMAIIQSSGTGKSRMVRELAGSRFSIILNLQATTDSTYHFQYTSLQLISITFPSQVALFLVGTKL